MERSEFLVEGTRLLFAEGAQLPSQVSFFPFNDLVERIWHSSPILRLFVDFLDKFRVQ
jgi:hypothetical protein